MTPDRDRLLLDTMLGKLARYLRMCGYDAAYTLDRGAVADDAVLDLAREEDRRLITRDGPLAARSGDALRLEARDIEDQLRELRDAGFELTLDRPARCGRCNGRVAPVPPTAETAAYAPSPDEEDVWRCRDCGRYFWRGSHWDDVRDRLGEL